MIRNIWILYNSLSVIIHAHRGWRVPAEKDPQATHECRGLHSTSYIRVLETCYSWLFPNLLRVCCPFLAIAFHRLHLGASQLLHWNFSAAYTPRRGSFVSFLSMHLALRRINTHEFNGSALTLGLSGTLAIYAACSWIALSVSFTKGNGLLQV